MVYNLFFALQVSLQALDLLLELFDLRQALGVLGLLAFKLLDPILDALDMELQLMFDPYVFANVSF